ncbi:diguanylate cyclase [Nonomuraea sp. NPDC050691]|uniref:sensor domain-containing diguanylate cyclase n=1 Tax=Nonomuraea sp. NPDC050691 TaxID=3155661 RepID=UPI0033CF9FF5
MAAPRHTPITPRDGVSTLVGRWPLLGQRRPLVVYLVGIVTLDLVAIVLLAASTPLRWPDIMAFVALMACGAACIEATRRLGMPAGVSRDLLSAWWLPVALLLPSLYALIAPIVLQILLQWRVRATVLHRRVFSSAAIGLAGCAASMAFHRLVPDPAALTRGGIEPIGWAVAAAVVFALLNTSLIALAAHMADPEVPWRSVLWDKESALLDVVELCLGVSVAISAGLNLGLLILALPPVVLLQRSLLHAQLQAAARTDPKTGLLNAAAWQREADTEIVRARRTGETLALLIIDIDHFKRVNDRHGHLVGDQVLAGVAATLRSQLREYDVVGRFGGEEFVVLLPGADVHEARQVAERLRNRISHMAVAADDAMITVTISVGVAIMSLHGDDLIELLAAADLALYRAKELGRNRICLPVIQPTHLADTQTAAIPVPFPPEDPHLFPSEDPHLFPSEDPHPEDPPPTPDRSRSPAPPSAPDRASDPDSYVTPDRPPIPGPSQVPKPAAELSQTGEFQPPAIPTPAQLSEHPPRTATTSIAAQTLGDDPPRSTGRSQGEDRSHLDERSQIGEAPQVVESSDAAVVRQTPDPLVAPQIVEPPLTPDASSADTAPASSATGPSPVADPSSATGPSPAARRSPTTGGSQEVSGSQELTGSSQEVSRSHEVYGSREAGRPVTADPPPVAVQPSVPTDSASPSVARLPADPASSPAARQPPSAAPAPPRTEGAPEAAPS